MKRLGISATLSALVTALALGMATAPPASAECRAVKRIREGQFYKMDTTNKCVAGSGWLKQFTDVVGTGVFFSGSYVCSEVVAGETGFWNNTECTVPGTGSNKKYVWAFNFKGGPWEECQAGKEKEAPTKYTSDECHEAASGNAGKWQWSEALETEKIKGVGFTITLTDTKATGGSSKVRCTAGLEMTGSVAGAGSKIETAEVSSPATNCTSVTGGCKTTGIEEVKGVHLPWAAFWSENAGKAVTLIQNGGSGEPGWEVVCDTVLGKITDTCESESTEKDEEATLENVFSSGVSLVTATYAKAHKAKCSVGGAEAGEEEGKIALLDKSGAGLRE
jgi:hypothetical protein